MLYLMQKYRNNLNFQLKELFIALYWSKIFYAT